MKTSIMHIVTLKALLIKLLIYLNKKAQIAFFLIKNIIILDKYSDFAKVFLKKGP